MPGLIDFSDEAVYDPETPEATRECAEFWMKVYSEGGLVEYLHWGGVGRFPSALQKEAQDLSEALRALEDAARVWTKDCGVRY